MTRGEGRVANRCGCYSEQMKWSELTRIELFLNMINVTTTAAAAAATADSV